MRARRISAAVVAALVATVLPGAAAAKPRFTRTVQVRVLRGSLFVTRPHRPVEPLTGSHAVPVGSIVDTREGVARITASDGRGRTYSGTFHGGTFRVVQRHRGHGTTAIDPTGKFCKALAAAGDGTSPLAVTSRRHRHPYVRGGSGPEPLPVGSRQIEADIPSGFVLVGRDARASAADDPARLRLADGCDGTHVIVSRGYARVDARRSGSRILSAGQSALSFCHRARSTRSYCLYLLADPGERTFTFGLALRNYDASSWRICFVHPGSPRDCFGEELARGAVQHSALRCVLNDGRELFGVEYTVDGHTIGYPFELAATEPRSSGIGSDRCSDAPSS